MRMPKHKKTPFYFNNAKQDGKHVLTLSGTIRKRYWSDDEVIDAKSVREALDEVNDDILIKLNSLGGDVFEGIEIYNYIKDHSSHITVEVTGAAASAATFILAGADEKIMNIGTTLMIHEAATLAWGNKKDIQKVLNSLDTIDGSLVSIYVEQTGQSVEQIESWMDEEKWFSAEEAVEHGFADSVKREEVNEDLIDNKAPIDITAMVQQAVVAAMAEYEKPVANDKPKEKPKSLINKLRRGE